MLESLRAPGLSAITRRRTLVKTLNRTTENGLINNLSRALPLIMEAGKPSLGTYVEWARQGVLMTYASDLLDSYRRAGIYAGKIIQGTKPGDLPIEQPTKFTLAINARTAKQLGISIPTALQTAADELIE